MKENTCCFFGHRTINETDELRTKITETVEKLIIDENVDTFLFGSKSAFDSLCLELVTELKEKYPQINRVYVRAEFPFISDEYKEYLMKLYDDTYYPENILGARRGVYTERNRKMIDKSQFCIVYYDEQYGKALKKSGTEQALRYAVSKGRAVINVF